MSSRIIQRKFTRRLVTIAQNSLNSLILPVFTIVISFLVIRLTSPELWGAFVSVLIVVQFGVHIAGWGNKEYLLREFSFRPHHIAETWQTSLTTRAALLAGLCGLLPFFGFSLGLLMLVILWSVGLAATQSYEVFVLYRKDFLFAIAVEGGAAGALIAAVISMIGVITVENLILAFTVVQLIKALAYVLRFRETLRGFHLRFEPRYFRLALPFFMLGFSGLLASRIDLYAVSYFLPERAVGEYQVFINLMLYLQSVSLFIVLPYVKSLYRLGDDAILKITFRLFLLGAALLIPALLAAHWLLLALYQIDYPAVFILLGGAFVLPVYAYLPLVYRLYKLDRQATVIKISLLGAGLNLALNILLLPHMGITGAILSSTVMQWVILTLYLVESRDIYSHASPGVPQIN